MFGGDESHTHTQTCDWFYIHTANNKQCNGKVLLRAPVVMASLRIVGDLLGCCFSHIFLTWADCQRLRSIKRWVWTKLPVRKALQLQQFTVPAVVWNQHSVLELFSNQFSASACCGLLCTVASTLTFYLWHSINDWRISERNPVKAVLWLRRLPLQVAELISASS